MERFWSKVNKRGKNECWEWTAGKFSNGYGQFYFEGKQRKAHRISWVLENNFIPKGKYILHKCDNPPCVNPNHLFLGTAKENMNDMRKKKRDNFLIGERHPRAKVTAEGVRILRGLHKNRKDISVCELAKEFLLSVSGLEKILYKQTWKHI